MGTDIGNVTIDGGGGITLNGSITTAGGNIDIDDAVTLATGAITLTTANGTVDFASTINGPQDLDISSGSGAVSIGGTIGGSSAISTLDINNSSGSGTITLNDIGDSSQGITGTSRIGNDTTATLTLAGTTYKTDQVTFTTTEGENIDLTGGSDTTFTTTNDSATFGTGTVELADGSNLIIDTGTGGGAINLAGVMGTSAENITLTAGTGNVAVGNIGTGTEIADVSITSSGNTTFSGDFTGGTLTNSGPAIVSADVTISSTGAINFGSTLDSHSGAQTITFNSPNADITITGAVGGSNPFSTFKITDAGTFTYSGGGSIAGFSSAKFSRTGGLAKFNPGPAIDNNNTIDKTKDKEIAFFDAPVFKLIKSFVSTKVTDIINEKSTVKLPSITSNEDESLAKISVSRAMSNSDFIKDSPIVDLSNEFASDETKEIDIEIDFLDGDTLIIDKSLEIANFEFDSLETSFEDIIFDLQIEDNSDLSFNIMGNEMFKNLSSTKSSDQTNLEELLISLSSTENLNQEKRFIF